MGPIQSSINSALTVASVLASQDPTFKAKKENIMLNKEANKRAFNTSKAALEGNISPELKTKMLDQSIESANKAIDSNLKLGKTEEAEKLKTMKNISEGSKMVTTGNFGPSPYDSIIKEHEGINKEIESDPELMKRIEALKQSSLKVSGVNKSKETLKAVRNELMKKSEMKEDN